MSLFGKTALWIFGYAPEGIDATSRAAETVAQESIRAFDAVEIGLGRNGICGFAAFGCPTDFGILDHMEIVEAGVAKRNGSSGDKAWNCDGSEKHPSRGTENGPEQSFSEQDDDADSDQERNEAQGSLTARRVIGDQGAYSNQCAECNQLRMGWFKAP